MSVVGSPRLVRHPDGTEGDVSRVEARLVLGPYGFMAEFVIFAADSVALPTRRKPKRTDELWQHTCLEVFLKPKEATRYVEFNFAPSTLWAAYEFDGYREGIRPLHMGAPSMTASRMGDNFHLSAGFHWRGWDRVETWRVGLSAVIETMDGTKSYWALAHPPSGPPDFHHPDCFALTLPAPGGA